jgi:hypothetical protein
VLVFLSSLPIAFAGAQARHEPVLIKIQLTEQFSEEVRVSGRILVGALVARKPGTHLVSKPIGMAIGPVAGAAGPICLQWTSRDGRYYAESRVQGLDAGGRPVLLTFDTAHEPLLNRLQRDDLALLAFSGDCAGGVQSKELKVFAIDRNKEKDGKLDGIDIVLNSERSDTVIRYADSAGNQIAAPCRRIEEKRRTSFDTVCELRAPLAETTKVTVERRRYERKLPALTVTLLVPAR